MLNFNWFLDKNAGIFDVYCFYLSMIELEDSWLKIHIYNRVQGIFTFPRPGFSNECLDSE